MRLKHIDAYARTHHGLITRDTALQLGMSSSAWYRAIRAGSLEEVHRQVARLPGVPHTQEQRVLAAVFAGGRGTMASHRSSAWLWGAPRPAHDPIEVSLPSRGRQATIPGVIVHRPRSKVDLRPVIRRGIPCTPAPRMLVELGAVDPRGLYDAMESLIIARVIPPSVLLDTLHRHASKGRNGINALRDAIDRYPLALQIADSTLETRMAALIERYHLPPMTFHEIIVGHEVDFRIDGTSIVLECDGREHHELGNQFELDRIRDAELLSEGYIVLRFTWRQLDRAPGKVAARIEGVLNQWAPDVLAVHRNRR